MSPQETPQMRRTDALAQALAARIFYGAWPEGHKLPADSALCSEFNVSRTVIREAFRLLRGKGLLIARPRIGTLVAPKANWSLFEAETLSWLAQSGLLAEKLDDIQDIRIALEPSFAALAASRADSDANQALQSALRALQETPSLENETQFLDNLYRACGNDFAQAALPLAAQAVQARDTAPPLSAYAELTAAIAQKDAARARNAAFEALIGVSF